MQAYFLLCLHLQLELQGAVLARHVQPQPGQATGLLILKSASLPLSVCLYSLQVQQQALGRLRPAPPPQDQTRHSRQGQQIQVGGPDLHRHLQLFLVMKTAWRRESSLKPVAIWT